MTASGAAADPTVTGSLTVSPRCVSADVEDDDGDVVGRAGIEALLEQPVGDAPSGPRASRAPPCMSSSLTTPLSPSEQMQPAVARLGVQDPRVDLGGGVDVAEHAHQHRAARVDHRLLLGDAPAVDETLHERVVDR